MPSLLAEGNRAVRERRHLQAIGLYVEALQAMPRLRDVIAGNIAIVRQQRRQSRGRAPLRIGLCGNAAAAERMHALARTYPPTEVAAVIACGPDHPCWQAFGAAGWAPQRIDTSGGAQFLDQAVRLVAAQPCDLVHVVGVGAPQVLLGALYKLLWDSVVLVDRHDAAAPSACLPSAPAHCQWHDAQWDAIAAHVAQQFDEVTVGTAALQEAHGGVMQRSVCGEHEVARIAGLRPASRAALDMPPGTMAIMVSDCHAAPQGVLDAARAIAALNRDDVRLLVLGHFDAEHASLKTNLEQIEGLRCHYLDALCERDTAWAAADAFLLATQAPQLPSCLAYAFARGVPVFAVRQAALADLFANLSLVPLESAEQAAAIPRHLAEPDALQPALAAARRLYASEFGSPVRAWSGHARPLGAAGTALLLQLARLHHSPLMGGVAALAALVEPSAPDAWQHRADAQRLQRFSGCLRQAGLGVAAATELAQRLLPLSDDDYLAALFQVALGRAPAAHELQHYQKELARSAERVAIARDLFFGVEGQTFLLDHGVPIAPPADAGTSPADTAPADAPGSLPGWAQPLVSVIIPVYGKLDYTLMCLRSIERHLPQLSFEVIVVDDCSPDDTAEQLRRLDGVRLVKNSRNLGFIRSCNHGASRARGEFLCFLNNDTEVAEGWLDALVRTFHDFPGTGLAGSKLIYPDGRLQEAGGILWQDGSAWNFGRLQDPLLPHFNYAREVDYCSGASIMLRKELFDELGGFDEHYLPAYCEDSDLALKVRARGLRVIYQPLSTVVHYEGITSGTDTGQGVKSYQVSNSRKLVARWQELLSQYQPNGEQVDRAKDRTARHRVLVLDHCTPTPNQDAGSVTTYNMLILLREMGFQVTFVPEDNFLYMPEYTTALQRQGIEVLYAPYVRSLHEHVSEAGERYDLVLMFRPGVVAKHLTTVREYCPRAKVLFHTIDLHFLRMQRESHLLVEPERMAEALAMKQREYAALRSVDASIVHSTAELELLRPDLPNEKIHVYPLVLDIRGTTIPFQQRRDVVFVGGYQHQPNVDAVHFFVTAVMPLLRQAMPGVRFFAVGSKPPPSIAELASDDVVITGFVDDLPPFLDNMRVAVAPLRYGAGIKGKIGTAMALGLPTVATTLAAEGMGLTDGADIVIADTPAQIVAAIARLYQDQDHWNAIQRQAIECAQQQWGPKAAYRILRDILLDLGFELPQPKFPLMLYR